MGWDPLRYSSHRTSNFYCDTYATRHTAPRFFYCITREDRDQRRVQSHWRRRWLTKT